MNTPLEQIRLQLARHDAVVVDALARRALCSRAPAGFYACRLSLTSALQAAPCPVSASFHEEVVCGYMERVLPLLASFVAESSGAVDALHTADNAALQAISTRLGLSLQVAACKLEGRDARLRDASEAGDLVALETLITYPSVEQLVLLRVRSRAADYVRTHTVAPELASRLPEALNTVYVTWLIPLSRAIQAAWLVAAARRAPDVLEPS